MRKISLLLVIVGLIIITSCKDDPLNPIKPTSNFMITLLNPSTARIGDLITVYGKGFKNTKDTNFISFNNIHASEYSFWSDTIIKVKVPVGATSGKVSITVNKMKSNEVEFNIFLSDPNPYESVAIGPQVWMKKNLDVDHYRNGDLIPQVTDSLEWVKLKTGAWCYNNNDPAMGNIYGKLYNWYAVNDPRGLAPAGWHIPSYLEYTELINNIGDTLTAGGDLKSIGTIKAGNGLWADPNTGATNKSGFSAIPGGIRKYPTGEFGYIGGLTEFWTSSVDLNDYTGAKAWQIELTSNTSRVYRYSYDKRMGFSVRCIKDFSADSNNKLKISSISPNIGKIGDQINLLGKGFGIANSSSYVSFNVNKIKNYLIWNDTLISIKIPNGIGTGIVYVIVNNLKSNEVYFTLQISPDEVLIGDQFWTTKNLDVVTYRNGDTIPNVTDSIAWQNLTTGAWCYYNNDPVLGAKYGKLYNWYALTDPRGLAPQGWNIPSIYNWDGLISAVKGDAGALRSTIGWCSAPPNSPITTNWTGFTALPGGTRSFFRDINLGYRFGNIDCGGYWWSSTEYNSNGIFGIRLSNTWDPKINQENNTPKTDGLSVRCVRPF